MKYIYGSAILFTMLLSGCTVGPDFERPDAPTAKSYTTEKNLDKFGSQSIKPNKIIAEKWWHEFSSPKLNAVVERGVKNNHYLIGMRKTLEQANEILDSEKAQLWPMISLDVAAGRQKYGASFLGQDSEFIPPFSYYEIGPSLTYLMDIFGITRRAIENAKALAEYQTHAYDAAYLSLTGKIVNTSLLIGMLNEQIATANKLVADDKKNLEMLKTAYQLGAVTQSEVLSAQNQLTIDEALLPRFRTELTKAKNALNQLVGSAPTEWQPPNFTMKDFKLPKDLPMKLPSELVRNRPDILAAEAVLHAANATVGIAEANMYPNIVITGSFMQDALTPANLFLASSSAWSYMGSITTPIFNAGMLKAQKRAAIRAYEASYENYKEVVLKSFIQVNDALHALQIDEEAERLGKTSLATAQQSLDLALQGQRDGGVSKLQVLAAQRQLMQSQLAYERIESQRYQDTVQLYLALGGSNTKR